jgi:hypothetical protein
MVGISSRSPCSRTARLGSKIKRDRFSGLWRAVRESGELSNHQGDAQRYGLEFTGQSPLYGRRRRNRRHRPFDPPQVRRRNHLQLPCQNVAARTTGAFCGHSGRLRNQSTLKIRVVVGVGEATLDQLMQSGKLTGVSAASFHAFFESLGRSRLVYSAQQSLMRARRDGGQCGPLAFSVPGAHRSEH